MKTTVIIDNPHATWLDTDDELLHHVNYSHECFETYWNHLTIEIDRLYRLATTDILD